MEKRSIKREKRRKGGWTAGMVIGIMGVCLVGTGCSLSLTGRLSASTEDLTEQYRNETREMGEGTVTAEFGEAYADFSLELLRESRNTLNGADGAAESQTAAPQQGQNVMVSPLSVMMALEMTRNGASTETLEQIGAVIYPGILPEEGKEGLLSFEAVLEEKQKEEGQDRKKASGLLVANSIWFQTDGKFVPEEDFLRSSVREYGAEIYGAPFDESTLSDINRWVENETNGMVRDILDEIPNEAVMYLVNAVAFEAEWQEPYETYQIGGAPFYGADGSETTVDMMYGEESRYLSGEHVTGFVKPYKEGYDFVALLPEEGLSLEEYIAGLDGATFLQTIADENDTIVETGIPKFEGETSLEMSGVLQQMGMPLAFDESGADFTKMGSCEDGVNIYIDRVLHKTYVNVDELGTKAGAATVVEMLAEGAAEKVPEPKRVILNRPFLYAVVERDTGLPVFIGTVEKL